MELHSLYGPSFPEQGWVPAPRYLLRRDRLLRFFGSAPKGRLLEVGCGAGALLLELKKLGLACEGLEISPAALELSNYAHRDSGVLIHSTQSSEWKAAFDYVCAFEVLEHIEDDRSLLAEWASWLRPGGFLILSVPAHQNRFNQFDRFAGHHRRYERRELVELAQSVGLKIERIECYGFPLADSIELIKRTLLRNRYSVASTASSITDNSNAEKLEQTLKSGVQRDLDVRLYPLEKSFIGKAIMRISFELQRLFLHTDFGGGYLMIARRHGT